MHKDVQGNTKSETVSWQVTVPIGASGATGTLVGPYPNGFAIAKNTTGVYDMTGIPLSPAGTGRWRFGIFSAALTIDSVVVTAFDETAGTATIKTVLGSASPVQPASGDKIYIFYSAETV